MLLDFSTHGWKEALKKFFTDLLKTMVAAAIAYIGTQLANYPITIETSPEIVALVGLVRALLSSALTWVTTSMFTITPGSINPAPSVEAVEQPQGDVVG